jgi:hypothetical protein
MRKGSNLNHRLKASEGFQIHLSQLLQRPGVNMVTAYNKNLP